MKRLTAFKRTRPIPIQVALAMFERGRRAYKSPHERKEAIGLVRTSGGRPGNLTKSQRQPPKGQAMKRRGYTVVGWITTKFGPPLVKRKLRERRQRRDRRR